MDSASVVGALPELVAHILRYVRGPAAMARCSSVCRLWRSTVLSIAQTRAVTEPWPMLAMSGANDLAQQLQRCGIFPAMALVLTTMAAKDIKNVLANLLPARLPVVVVFAALVGTEEAIQAQHAAAQRPASPHQAQQHAQHDQDDAEMAAVSEPEAEESSDEEQGAEDDDGPRQWFPAAARGRTACCYIHLLPAEADFQCLPVTLPSFDYSSMEVMDHAIVNSHLFPGREPAPDVKAMLLFFSGKEVQASGTFAAAVQNTYHQSLVVVGGACSQVCVFRNHQMRPAQAVGVIFAGAQLEAISASQTNGLEASKMTARLMVRTLREQMLIRPQMGLLVACSARADMNMGLNSTELSFLRQAMPGVGCSGFFSGAELGFHLAQRTAYFQRQLEEDKASGKRRSPRAHTVMPLQIDDAIHSFHSFFFAVGLKARRIPAVAAAAAAAGAAAGEDAPASTSPD